MKNYKGYTLFNDVNKPDLRAFNRVQTMVNINENVGEQLATEYVEQFDGEGKRDMAIVANWIKREGIESVSRQVRGA